jgi:hypothetical protein
MKLIPLKDYEILTLEVLNNRSMAENNPLNLIKGYKTKNTLKRIFEQVGQADFIFWVNFILDENE